MFLGLDLGSLAAKAVLLDGDRRVVASAVADSGPDHSRVAEDVTSLVLNSAGLSREDVVRVVGTGYGRKKVPFADLTVTEISCHARGAAELHPGCRTVIDIGGQDSKVIRVDEEGRAVDFSMNDRCAAGTGRFLEVMARALEVPLREVGSLAARAHQAARISSVCTVFAESEIVGLVAEGEGKENILRGLCLSIAERISGLASRVGTAPPIVMTGGVALNGGVVSALEEKLSHELFVPGEPQLAGALGAALIAAGEEGGMGRR